MGIIQDTVNIKTKPCSMSTFMDYIRIHGGSLRSGKYTFTVTRGDDGWDAISATPTEGFTRILDCEQSWDLFWNMNFDIISNVVHEMNRYKENGRKVLTHEIKQALIFISDILSTMKKLGKFTALDTACYESNLYIDLGENKFSVYSYKNEFFIIRTHSSVVTDYICVPRGIYEVMSNDHSWLADLLKHLVDKAELEISNG